MIKTNLAFVFNNYTFKVHIIFLKENVSQISEAEYQYYMPVDKHIKTNIINWSS